MSKRLRDFSWWLWLYFPRAYRMVHRWNHREERRIDAEEVGQYLLEREAFREVPWHKEGSVWEP